MCTARQHSPTTCLVPCLRPLIRSPLDTRPSLTMHARLTASCRLERPARPFACIPQWSPNQVKRGPGTRVVPFAFASITTGGWLVAQAQRLTGLGPVAGGVKRPHGFYRAMCRQHSSPLMPTGEGGRPCLLFLSSIVFTPPSPSQPAATAAAPITAWRDPSCGYQPRQECTRKVQKGKQPSLGLRGGP